MNKRETYSSSDTPGRTTGSSLRSKGADCSEKKEKARHVSNNSMQYRSPGSDKGKGQERRAKKKKEEELKEKKTHNLRCGLLLLAPALAEKGLNTRVQHPDVAFDNSHFL